MAELVITSVNVGKPEHIPGYSGLTGIVKRPAPGPVEIGPYGLAGDHILDTRNHGGLDQAVYLYGLPDYAFWSAELGRALEPGLFGENLTVAGLESARINVGDRFELGGVLLEASAPRNPCSTFAARMGDPYWAKRFLAGGRPGVYARVLRGGPVQVGIGITLAPFSGERVPLTELTYDYKHPAPERMRYLLKAPIHRDLVAHYQASLAQGELPL